MASTTDLADRLADHGDRQVPAGAIDLAVNVLPGPPAWLAEALASVDLAAYPDPEEGRAAAALRHRVQADHCLLTHGAAEAFWLVAQALRPRLAACVHPSFTAPEAALRGAGVEVARVQRRREDFALDPDEVPEAADLVVIGRPDNPTGSHEELEVVARLARPGRTLVVDESFADFLPAGDDARGLADVGLPGVLCVRSLTKLWGLAGLRVGYVLGAPELLARLDAVRQPWPVSSPAIRAVALACAAEVERRRRAEAVARDRDELLAGLAGLPLRVWASPANFLLLRGPRPDLRERLLDQGLAVRRAETFPGLDAHYVRTAVSPDPLVRERLVEALAHALQSGRSGKSAGLSSPARVASTWWSSISPRSKPTRDPAM